MTADDFTTCAYCPRLCRHVCPVSVATARESATPTAMATVALLSLRGKLEPGLALSGTELCIGCGACERHCHWHIDVAGRIGEFRSQAGAPDEAVPAPAIANPAADGVPTFRTCWEESTGTDGQLACCGGRESFITRQPEAAEAMARQVAARMDNIPHRCNVSTCASWLRRHGAEILGPTDVEPFYRT